MEVKTERETSTLVNAKNYESAKKSQTVRNTALRDPMVPAVTYSVALLSPSRRWVPAEADIIALSLSVGLL